MDADARDHSEWMGSTGRFVHSGDNDGENILEFPVGFVTSTMYGIPISRERVGSPLELGQDATASWMDSPGHRENLLDGSYHRTGMGIAVVEDPGGNGQIIYFTQNFKR